jgi:uncharacterized RDD family membrane protein YckC
MTQQDETQQQGAAQPDPLPQPGTAPAEPASPPPTLYGYESVPEAYLAPPQPGQPRYGTPPHLGGRPFPGQSGYGEPGYGQPAGGQPGYGRPAPAPAPASGRARPGLGAAAQRDPALAPAWQRLVAQTIDWTIIIVVSVILFLPRLLVMWRELQAVASRYPDLSPPAAQAAVDSIFRNPSNEHTLLYWFLGMFGLALAYYWVQHAAWGATVGKRALGMRVVRVGDRSRVGVLAAGIRAVAFLAGPAIFLFGSVLSLVGGVLWAADAGLPLVDARAQSLHDKIAGTVVVRQRALQEPGQRSGG